MNAESLNLSTSNGATTAYVTRPDESANACVLLIQEWWGINDHIRDLAGRYAREGYLCVAPDLYRGRLAADSTEASALMHALASEDGVETISYDADHAFFNDTRPEVYDAEAAKDAWRKVQEHFRKHLSQ